MSDMFAEQQLADPVERGAINAQSDADTGQKSYPTQIISQELIS
jgi:hypothetical protein